MNCGFWAQTLTDATLSGELLPQQGFSEWLFQSGEITMSEVQDPGF